MWQIKIMKWKIGNSWGVGGLYMTPLEQKFQGGGGGWGVVGIDIFWNHTICICRVAKISLIGNRHSTFKCNLACAIFLARIFAGFKTGPN